jgi:DnaK suppressor protein
MFVSFLQRFGFLAPSAAVEPIRSSAGRDARPIGQDNQAEKKANKRQDGRITLAPVFKKTEGHPQASAQRRQDVNAPAKKSKSVVKVAAKVAAQVTVKPALKTAVKATVSAKKSTTKEVTQKKIPARSVIKPVVKPIDKPMAKSTVKPAAKPVSKTPPSSVVKAAPSSAAKAASTPTQSAPAPSPAVPSAPKTMITPPPPLKPGRRSSARTAAQSPPPAPMVPTHAPDAAKASYSTITERVISPPPHVAARKDPKLANNWLTKEGSALTDEEVKAMPDSEYMNDKQLAFFRNKLSILKSEIHASAGQTTENLREDTVVVPDPADRATIEEEHALELRTRDRERKLLKKIEQSISRIDAGDYGYCDETGETIGVGRLIARPTASLSLEAQQRRELKQKLFGD